MELRLLSGPPHHTPSVHAGPSTRLCDNVPPLDRNQAEAPMSVVEAKVNLEARGSIDAVVSEYAFPDVHIGPGEDESPGCPSRKTSSSGTSPSTSATISTPTSCG